MTAPPLVSVVIPCWNGGAYLAQAVDSVRAQSMPDWECIIVDDGSTDGTPEIAAGLTRADRRIGMTRQRRRGIGGARNRGIDLARGDYVQFLDADDAILPDKLGLQLAALRGLPGPALAYCDYANVLTVDVEMPPPPGPFYLPPRLDPERPLAHLAEGWETSLSIPAHCFLLERRIFTELGIRFDERLPSHEDWDCWMRVLGLGPTLRYVDQTLAVYRRRPDSVSSNRRLMRRGFLRAIDMQRRRHRHDPGLSAVLAAKRAAVGARYRDAAPGARLRRAILGGISVVGTVVPVSIRRRLGPVLRDWIEG
ncbi:MAG: glycosyltransferase family 2 protein [Candidatus Rokuibacteriota bacterium]